MNIAIKHIINMYENELYSNVVKVIDLILSASDQKQDIVKFQYYLYYAESQYHLQQYTQAEQAYSQALQVRKFIIKTKSAEKANDQEVIASDTDIKYKMHLCFLKLGKQKNAMEILQSVSIKLRDSKINMALGNLYRDTGCERSAISCYKEVLKENPLAVEAAENLLKLSVKGIEVHSLMLEVTSELNWLDVWIKAHSQMCSKDYQGTINAFKSLEMSNLLKSNTSLLVTIANCYMCMSDNKNALNYLQRAVRIDPDMITGRDLYASLLMRSQDKENLQELERLIHIDLDMNLWSCEHWVVIGYNMLAQKLFDRATRFAHKALSLNKRSFEAMLLKGYSLMDGKHIPEAILHFKEAKTIAPERFEPYKALTECYLSTLRTREAINIASHACKILNNTPQALTLHAKVLQKELNMSSKVRDLLDKALNKDPSYQPALWLLVEHLEQQQKYEEACNVMLNNLKEHPSSKSHQMLGDCFVRLLKEDEALTHYSTAIRLDPCNQRALEGLNAIGRGGKTDSNYYVTMSGESSSIYTPQNASTVPSDPDFDGESDRDVWEGSSDYMFEY